MTVPWRRSRLGSIVRSWLKSEPIYVQIRIRAPIDHVWHHTQTPIVHARWDLRFTDIDYLPRTDPDDPQHFRYATRIGPLAIVGEGVTVGTQDRLGSRTSALEFGSDDRKSLIKHGSGYWQYLQTDDGVCFLTQYSYAPRWGRVGACIDRVLFRQLLGWATAWSFDRLRLWLEKGLDPSVALRQSVIHATARLALATIWLYQGVVPKLFYPDSGELDFVRAAGLSNRAAMRIVRFAGWAEICAGLATIALWNRRAVFPVSGMLLIMLAGGTLARQPASFRAPFNPASLTVAAVSLTIVGYLAARDLPSSRNCLRVKPKRVP